MKAILLRSSLRYLPRHPWHTILSVLGVALGVAVVFSIDAVNASARTAFRRSTDAVAGRATHRVVGGPAGVPDAVYTDLRTRLGVRDSAPVVEGYLGFDRLPGQAFRLIGIDPFAEAPFRARLQESRLLGRGDLGPFLLEPGAVVLPAALAARLGVSDGDRLEARVDGRGVALRVLRILDPSSGSGDGYESLVIADVSTAQEVLDRVGRLDRIDLIAPEEGRDAFLGMIRDALPAGAEVSRSGSRTEQVENMTAAFRQNLFALSLLALVVGMFLIYNTMTFSIVQRRELIGDWRTLGVTRREVFGLVLSEAAIIGLAGTALGLLGGLLLARGLIGMVTRTINDLYFVLDVQRVDVTPGTLGKAVLLGLGATLLAAAIPAREATRTPPRFVQNRSVLESRLRGSIPRLTIGGGLLLAAGALLLALPVRHVLFTFVGLLPLIAGFALLTPGFLLLVLGRSSSLFRRPGPLLGRLAVRGILSQLSRSAVAIAALAIAVGTTVGVTTMIDSFRESVVVWLDRTLDSDIYISRPSSVASRNVGTMDPDLVARLMSLDGVAGANLLRGLLAETQHGVANLTALGMHGDPARKFRIVEGAPGSAWPRVEAGEAVLVSEPYAYRHRVSPGDAVELMTATGRRAFPVAGVYTDFASDIGTVLIGLEAYRALWRDETLSGVGLVLRDPAEAPAVLVRVRGALSPADDVLVRSNRDLKETSMEIFDRTFAITYVLRTLTVVVAFIGVLSALMALQFERGRELGVLRAIGLTPGQLWRLVTLQTGLMGLLSGIVALPFGLILAVVLVYIVNRRSFGWSLDLQLGAGVFLQALLVAVVAAVLAGLYPGFRMARTSPARALREE